MRHANSEPIVGSNRDDGVIEVPQRIRRGTLCALEAYECGRLGRKLIAQCCYSLVTEILPPLVRISGKAAGERLTQVEIHQIEGELAGESQLRPERQQPG